MRDWELAWGKAPAVAEEESRPAWWWLKTVAILVLGGGLYGAAMGAWQGPAVVRTEPVRFQRF